MNAKKEHPIYIKIPVVVYNDGKIEIRNNCKIESGRHDFIFDRNVDKSIYGYREGFVLKEIKPNE